MTTMMEENTAEMFNIGEESIKFYCRVCTCNTRTKKSKPEDSIAIFKRTGLKSILEKYLHLQISEDDQLPKVICKACFDKLMAIEFLQIVARRTETLLRDFLSNKKSSKAEDIYNAVPHTNQPPISKSKLEDVVVNVSMSDPLTKNIHKKLQVAQNTRDSIGAAFSPEHMSRNAVTSSPVVPVTIVHRMPKKRKTIPKPPETNQVVQIPPQTSTTTVTLQNPPKQNFVPIKPKPTSILRPISDAPTIPQNVEIHPVITGNPSVMGHGMPLGSIIKDEDLLKLILKALKWPYNSQTLDIQIQRLKNTNFHDIIVDPNLLQDTDLIQILGPLIAPLPVTMQQQTYHITIPPDMMPAPPTTMSYKLPAETSVQIITVPAEEKETSKPKPLHAKRHFKSSSGMRKKSGSTINQRHRFDTPVIIVSDESEEESSGFGVQLDPVLYPSVEDSSNSNETMLATLNRQREAMMRMHRSKRKQSLSRAKNVEMVDDIMIVDEGFHIDEPYPDVVVGKKNQRSHDVPTPTASSLKPKAESSTALPTRGLIVKDPPPQSFSTKQTQLETSKPPSLEKTVQRRPEHSKPTKRLRVDSAHKLLTSGGFVKLKEGSNLPPLKKVKLVPKSTSHVAQGKEPTKPTVADADSTTKIVVKETQVPERPIVSDDKRHKVKLVKKIKNSTSVGQPNSARRLKRVQKFQHDTVIVLDCDDEETQVSEAEKKNSTTDASVEKNELKILGTFDISDEEMERLHVDEPSEEASALEQGTTSVGEKTSPAKKTPVVDESTTKTTTASQPISIDQPAAEAKDKSSFELVAIEIKKEDSEEIQIKKEEIESNDTSKTGENDGNKKKSLVDSKTPIKSEVQKQTRTATKRKVQQKEEPPIEINTVTSDRLSRNQAQVCQISENTFQYICKFSISNFGIYQQTLDQQERVKRCPNIIKAHHFPTLTPDQ